MVISTRKDKALEELKRQIATQKSRLPPDVLEKAARALQGKQPSPTTTPAGSVPYDRAAAAKAIELFLSQHDDAKTFQKRLLERLKKETH